MSKRKMTAKYLKEMVKKSFANVDIDDGGKMCVLPFQSLVDAVELYEDKLAWQEVEFQQLKEDYESIVEENSLLKADHKLMSDKLIALEVETNNQKAEIERLKGFIDFKTANIMCEKCKEQAVKDRAREILDEVKSMFVDTNYNIDCIVNKLEKIAEKYIVEVE